jgi:hypothetical protein
MLGYYRSQERAPDQPNNKKLKLLIQNLENIIELLKEEVFIEEEEEEEVKNVVRLEDMIQKIQSEFEEPEYEEED